jgi:hypothetical protein
LADFDGRVPGARPRREELYGLVIPCQAEAIYDEHFSVEHFIRFGKQEIGLACGQFNGLAAGLFIGLGWSKPEVKPRGESPGCAEWETQEPRQRFKVYRVGAQ